MPISEESDDDTNDAPKPAGGEERVFLATLVRDTQKHQFWIFMFNSNCWSNVGDIPQTSQHTCAFFELIPKPNVGLQMGFERIPTQGKWFWNCQSEWHPIAEHVCLEKRTSRKPYIYIDM